jgi:hypothetical protein
MNEITEKIYQELKKKYKRSVITKKELAQELGCTISTIDKNMQNKSKNLPLYKKISDKGNGRVIFPIQEVAIFLAVNN